LQQSAKKHIVLSLITVFVYVQEIHALDMSVSGREIGASAQMEYNLGFTWHRDFRVLGSVEFNKLLALKGGISAGSGGDVFTVNGFLSSSVLFPSVYVPFTFKLAYMYNSLPEYETNTHTLLPLGGMQWKYFGMLVGVSFRFSKFWDTAPVLESLPAYAVYVNFLNSQKAKIGIEMSNFSDFESKNLGSYSYSLKSIVHITRALSITNDFEIQIAGSIAHILRTYGYAYKGGIVYSW
jgi:hypothetical protein